jgi:thymidylate kinase
MMSSTDLSRLIVFEGPDGVGKTTVAQEVCRELDRGGVPATYLSFPGHDEGTLGNLVYKVHHDAVSLGVTTDVHAVSLQVLHVAAHIDAIENRILPTLAAGTWVVLDRFWWSTWVYGTFSGLPEESRDRMIELELCHWKNVRPSVLFLVERVSDAPGYPELRDFYRMLSRREQDAHSIIELDNAGPLNDTVSAVLEHLGVV